jgi:hypothetical protein
MVVLNKFWVDLSAKALKSDEGVETELVLTALRAAGCGTLSALIDANYKSKFKSVKTW